MQLEYFQLIDRILDLNIVEKTITVEAQVPTTSTVFEGHFPGYPIMPGVLLLETMNHASGYLMLGLNGFSKLPFFAGTKRVKIKRFVTPGTLMKVRIDLVHEGSGFCMTSGEIKVGDEVVAEAEITMMLMNFPSEELAEEVRHRAAKVGFALAQSA